MSFGDKIKKLIFKQPATASVQDQEGSTPNAEKEGVEAPYLAARKSWNSHVGSIVEQNQIWQFIAIGSAFIAIACIGGLIIIGSQSKYIPYVIEVDKLGRPNAVGPVSPSAPNQTNSLVVSAALSDFITDARLVTPDVGLQTKAIYDVYAHLSPNDPATLKMNEWLNGSEEANPYKRASKEMVHTEIKSVLQQSAETWQVEWAETTRDRQGALQGAPVNMRALITVYNAAPTEETTEEQLRQNPLGIYVRNFSWSPLL